MTDNDIIREARERFGSERTDDYLRTAKAMRALIHIWHEYINAPSDTPIEAVLDRVVEKMMDDLAGRPEHTKSMVEALVVLIEYMRRGGTYEDWFESLGLSPGVGGDDDD